MNITDDKSVLQAAKGMKHARSSSSSENREEVQEKILQNSSVTSCKVPKNYYMLILIGIYGRCPLPIFLARY